MFRPGVVETISVFTPVLVLGVIAVMGKRFKNVTAQLLAGILVMPTGVFGAVYVFKTQPRTTELTAMLALGTMFSVVAGVVFIHGAYKTSKEARGETP